MNIHEYQAKELFKSYGIRIPRGVFAQENIENIFKSFGSKGMLKVQALTGGRGAVGGVVYASSQEECQNFCNKFLNKRIVTKQTGIEGEAVEGIYIEEQLANINQEAYLSMMVDRTIGCVSILCSKHGGINIEEARSSLMKIFVPNSIGITDFIARRVALNLGVKFDLMTEFLRSLYKLLLDFDALMIEINPLAIMNDGSLVAMDAKMNFDDNALFRQKYLWSIKNTRQESEGQASQHGVQYVKLDGNIGCMVNGAGMAMATMDMLEAYNLKAANFLDIGGTADIDKIIYAYLLLANDPSIECIFINIFGGMVRCDLMAQGLITAMQQSTPKKMVIRFEGAQYEDAHKLLESVGISLQKTTADALQAIVAAVRKDSNYVNTD